jgi:hypothetical protein
MLLKQSVLKYFCHETMCQPRYQRFKNFPQLFRPDFVINNTRGEEEDDDDIPDTEVCVQAALADHDRTTKIRISLGAYRRESIILPGNRLPLQTINYGLNWLLTHKCVTGCSV